MSALMDSYEKKYGSAEKVFLRSLNGDPDTIAKELAELPDDLTSLGFDLPFAANSPEDDLHFAILREIQQRYFSDISRERALAVCEVLSDLGELRPCPSIPDLCYNSFSFMRAWNDANSDQPPIRVNGAEWFSV